MKKTIRENITAPYSLHDMNVVSFEVKDNDVIMRTQSGIIKTEGLSSQVDGYVEFYNVQWDFSYVYLFDFTGNVGKFCGEKMFFNDFIEKYKPFGFSILDETYGYNQTKYAGFLLCNGKHFECMVEIYHEGEMVFVAEK